MQSHGKTRHFLWTGTSHVSSVRAELKSEELSIGTERMLLLSIKAHATLGLVKDTRAGTSVLKDSGQYAPFYEVMGSDLGFVCISDWHTFSPNAKFPPDLGVEAGRDIEG